MQSLPRFWKKNKWKRERKGKKGKGPNFLPYLNRLPGRKGERIGERREKRRKEKEEKGLYNNRALTNSANQHHPGGKKEEGRRRKKTTAALRSETWSIKRFESQVNRREGGRKKRKKASSCITSQFSFEHSIPRCENVGGEKQGEGGERKKKKKRKRAFFVRSLFIHNQGRRKRRKGKPNVWPLFPKEVRWKKEREKGGRRKSRHLFLRDLAAFLRQLIEIRKKGGGSFA